MEKRHVHKELARILPIDSQEGKIFELSTKEDSESINMAIAEIQQDIRHHHSNATELYFVIEGKGTMEIDHDTIELYPGSFVMLKPGAVHKATKKSGEKLKIVVASSPAWNPKDHISDEG